MKTVMELPIIAVLLLASFILTVDSHPKNSDVIPKDYYKRQILQPIPGYIPVYIKADGVPLVRTESKKHSSNGTPEKVGVPNEKQLLKESDDVSSPQTQDKTRSESAVTESKNQPTDPQEKNEPTADLTKNEKPVEKSQVKTDNLKP